MESDISPKTDEENNKPRPIKRRARMALSCQRCRKHRSKCSRSRPECEQCSAVGASCVYLEAPGDLESTALRDRFAGLENQIHSLINEFGHLEQIVKSTVTTNNQTNTESTKATLDIPSHIRTNSLQKWKIHQLSPGGLSIDTHMFHVTDIYSTLIQFAKDNTNTLTLYPKPEQQKKPVWLIRNHSLFPNVRLSHFTSLRPDVHDGEDTSDDDPRKNSTIDVEEDEDNFSSLEKEEMMPEPLSPILVERLLSLYKRCLLYGAVQPFDTLFKALLLDPHNLSPTFQLLYASIICHMLPHAFYWHKEIFENLMDKSTCVHLSIQYYKWAKRLLSSIYFDAPSLTTCHAICNLVLYHIENGNTSVIYIYSGMAVRMALSLQLYREDALDSIAQQQIDLFPIAYRPPVLIVKEYARSLLWFMYFLDTASSHYHNKPYEIHLDDHVSTTTYFKKNPAALLSSEINEQQAFFQFIEFHTCQITRDIRRTIFTHPEERQTAYDEIERIEKRLLSFQKQLPNLHKGMIHDSDIWERRCFFKQWIRHHGHWILIHQTYLPTPMSVQRCTTAAFALVDLFDHWIVNMDCYFRPCVHELKQACEILLYHVDQNTPIKDKALEGLMRLIQVLLKTPVGEIARTRPFVQRVLKVIEENNTSL
ncbi:uncharacterized protein BX663DRAFT_517939 [Cokeromyces recurvatus]|uniref:uncharacterized protein n=1 Tax=Cokeromyces recurvatus TaxID=90255 RepID=UPI0022201769|nr:uncharacterized protein BX663DRAFT_517939 [Cokeromyces recurvatus]KAI7900530.1 hypothetical protein BX663DRAFT_517939 [Cokeromyces recurvatus]